MEDLRTRKWSEDERRTQHAAYMRAYYADPAHPERRDKKRQTDRNYAALNRERANQKAAEWYESDENKRKVAAREAKKRLERKIKALSYASTQVCVHCQFDHPAALQFHHRNPLVKNFRISDALKLPNKYGGWEIIAEEIIKCDVVCSNCHAILHSAWTNFILEAK